MVAACEMINQGIENYLLTKKLKIMKKLNKLQINPEKVLRKEELTFYKGGDWYGTCEVMCDYKYFNASAAAENCFTAELICEGMWSGCDCKCC
jgi:natural product precursor